MEDFAQTLKFEKFTTRDGLISDEVYGLHQDKKGYLWAFTNYGALKYNGLEFKPVLRNLPFHESFIYAIFENKNGRMWVANSKAMVYEIINDSAIALEGSGPASELLRKDAQEVLQIHVDDSLNVFLITKSRCLELIKKGDRYQFKDLTLRDRRDSINVEIFEKQGLLVPVRKLYREEFLEYRDPTGIRTFNLLFHLGKPGLRFQVSGKQYARTRHFKKYGNDIYFPFNDALFKISGNRPPVIIQLNAVIQNFTKDKNNHLWVATYDKGLIEVNEKDSVINSYLKNAVLNDVLLDSENGLWVSSTSGLHHCKNLSSRYFTDAEPLGKAITFIKPLDDNLFVANANGELYMVRHDTFKLVIADEARESLLEIIKSQGGYRVSYRHKIQSIKLTNHGTSKVSSTLVVENGLKMQFISDNKFLFCSRNIIGLAVNGQIKEKMVKVDQKIYGFEYNGKELFVATDKGVYKLSPQALYSLLNPSGRGLLVTKLTQPGNLLLTHGTTIVSIVPDGRGNLWFCSLGGGIYVLNLADGKMRHLSQSNGLPTDVINNISFNKNDFILLCTNTGLFLARRKGSDTTALTWKKIYPEAVSHAFIFEGKVHAGTTNGLVILDQTKFAGPQTRYLNLNSVTVNSELADTTILSSLRHDQNDLEFVFDLISFSSENKTQLKYFLSGAFTEAGTVKNNSVKLQHMPFGGYTLTVFAADDKKLKIVVPFTIAPAFNQTLAFKIVVLSCLLLFIVAIFGVIQMRNSRNLKKQREFYELNHKVKELEIKVIKAQMNPHFISNCLAAIQNLIYANQVAKAGQYLAKFSFFLRQVLDYSDKTYITLEEELDFIKLNTELELLRFKNNFTFNIHVDKDVKLNEILIPSLITQPFIENAIWHGLLPLKERDPKLEVRVISAKETILIEIEDNGVGRSAEGPFTNKNSKGTKLANDKIDSINKLRESNDFKMEIFDLVDENRNPRGTKIIIQLIHVNPEE
jgi:ligand-binding sensor domain-containing protein